MQSLYRVAFALSVYATLALTGSTVNANEQPDQLVTGKKLLIKHKSDATKSKLVFISKDPSFVLPNAGSNPVLEGATLQVVDMATGTGATFALNASFWTAIPNGYKYKNPSGSPCRVVIIKLNKLLKAVCKGTAVTLTPPLVGGGSAQAGVILRVGTDTVRYCAVFGSPLRNEGTGPDGKFIAKNANAPVACPYCGNGTVNGPDETCDDGNNANGDCCTAACQAEPNGNACDDGDPCTTGGSCLSGVCNSSPACGNDTVDPGCGEQCDGSDDGACDAPGFCGDDCQCIPAPTCDADPTRVLFMGTEDACESLTNQGTCDTAYIRHPAGVTSCYWNGGDCFDCTPTAQAEGLCQNTCVPITCPGDPSRTTFVGGPEYHACHQFDGDQAGCEQAFHHSAFLTPTSCYYDSGTDECNGCGPGNQENGHCTNTCAACPADPTRTIFAGGPNVFAACDLLDGDEASCNQAFQLDDNCFQAVSCFYDNGDCLACDASALHNLQCRNTCEVGPSNCVHDPSRTIFAGGPQSQACHAFDGDPNGCVAAYHHTSDRTAASCYYDFGNDLCSGCGPGSLSGGECVNTCQQGPPDCSADPSRVFFLGGPGESVCDIVEGTTGSQALCEQAYHLGREGFASCFWDDGNCRGCGPGNENQGRCQNTCSDGPVTCEDNPARTDFVGGSETSACTVYSSTTGDSTDCDGAFHIGRYGVASCFFDDSNQCRGCGVPNSGECTNECDAPSCDGDPARTVYAGGVSSGGCHQFDGLPSACNQAFHIGQYGIASCYYDAGECRGCGPNNEETGDCINTCPVCEEDPARTSFVGGPNNAACHQYDNNEAACETAFHHDQNLKPTSCYYDPDSGDCNGCGTSRIQDGACQNTCDAGPEACAADPARTVDAGGPNTAACQQFDGNPLACGAAFHHGQNGIASCYYDVSGDTCLGCGPNNEDSGSCINSCVFGPIACDQDPSRVLNVGGPNTGACHLYDADQASCEQAYHVDQNRRAASCWWDADNDECRGCGPQNADQCRNTCVKGPIECANDPSRGFAGGPQTGACFELLDEASCLGAYHLGQCGAASCYWTGLNCQGCGPYNHSYVECFNTCVAP